MGTEKNDHKELRKEECHHRDDNDAGSVLGRAQQHWLCWCAVFLLKIFKNIQSRHFFRKETIKADKAGLFTSCCSKHSGDFYEACSSATFFPEKSTLYSEMDVFFRSFVNDSDLVCEISHSGPNRALPSSFDSAPGHYKAAPPVRARGWKDSQEFPFISLTSYSECQSCSIPEENRFPSTKNSMKGSQKLFVGVGAPFCVWV
ncbi:hypothetical protein CDAR_292231 [Caerostris darwini]|uniref:Uncharacterized protein n=1 Tax=Caerostris darwini TaxID=1538125 RepID=A0AAV4VPI7_9ARAC|nr:hypothetical protein CDAR_292231 [Caerostris darwini]